MEDGKRDGFDVIVIGSGLGGLSTAGLLAKIYKKKVLVLERHYEPGGLTHEFKRGPYTWDVGLHYMGDMDRRFLDRIGSFLFKLLTNGKLEWNKTPNPFDKFVFPDFSVNISASVKAYKKELSAKFPKQKRVIKRYIKDVHAVRRWYLARFFSSFLHPPLSQIFAFLSKFNNKKALMTTKEYLDKYISDEKLKAVLISRWGNYGIPPTESAFAIHALIEHHYYSGSSFPSGGAEKIAAYIEETIVQSGGKILINKEVTKIILEGNKAVGVKVKDLSAKDKKSSEYYAPVIVSGAGVKNTFLELLPKELNLPIQQKLSDFFPGYSGLNIYLGLKKSPEALGIKGENYWIMNNYNLDSFNAQIDNILEKEPNYCFVSFPSLKSGKHNAHTAEIVSIFPFQAFDKWGKSFWKERGNDYHSVKDKLIDRYIDYVEKEIPGFKDLIVYKEMATPLTFEQFTNRRNGTFYGLPATPERYKLDELKVKTSIDGLYLTGTDILSNGVMPALFSGMATASYIAGSAGILNVMSKAFLFKPSKHKHKRENAHLYNFDKNSDDMDTAFLIDKKQTSPNIIELIFKFSKKLNFIPGQHVKVLVGDSEWRSYSAAKTDGEHLTLIIDTRPDGHGSKFAKNININELALFRLPLTDLVYHESDKDIMFIATGTGMVPFLHILDELKKKDIKRNVVVLFGCLNEEDNFIDDYIRPYEDFFTIEKNICVDNGGVKASSFNGNIVDFINQGKYKLANYDYYICGHPHMTNAVAKLLRTNGVEKIYF